MNVGNGAQRKVKKFLEQLEKDEMITFKSDTKKTLITIENYSVYQDRGNSEETDKRTLRKHRGKSKEKQKEIQRKIRGKQTRMIKNI